MLWNSTSGIVLSEHAPLRRDEARALVPTGRYVFY